MIRFAHPHVLNLLWLTLGLLVIFWWDYRWRKRRANQWAELHLHSIVLPTLSLKRILLKYLLTLASIICGIIALSGPQVGTRVENIVRQGVDIVIALDLSESMLAEDVLPNRFSKARLELMRFFQELKGDRVALVPFAGSAHIQVPLTLDYDALSLVLNSLEPSIMPLPGSDIGDALRQSLKAFRKDSPTRKILILISDGEDHMGTWEKAIEDVKNEDVEIITVGIGTIQGAPIPIKEQGILKGYKKDKVGAVVITRLNEDVLKRLSQVTGGEYYPATPSGDEFRAIIQRIEGKEKATFEEKKFTDYEHRFQWFVMLVIILLGASEIFPTYKPRLPV